MKYLDKISFTKLYTIFQFILQQPIAIVSPGPQLHTCNEADAITSSGFEVVYWPKDINEVQCKGILIVIVYNGVNHYCPTVLLSESELNAWVIRNLIKHLEKAAHKIINVDLNLLNDDGQDQLRSLSESV